MFPFLSVKSHPHRLLCALKSSNKIKGGGSCAINYSRCLVIQCRLGGRYDEHIVLVFGMEAFMATSCDLVFSLTSLCDTDLFTMMVTPRDALFSVTLPILL